MPGMNDINWILFDTETTGMATPIFVIELAALRMRGWTPDSEPFRKLLESGKTRPFPQTHHAATVTPAKFWSATANRRCKFIGILRNTRVICRSSRSI